MSLEQVRRALDQASACGSAPGAHVLLVLAWYADPDGGNVRPSVPRITRETGLGERTVQRALRHLERLGFLTPERRSAGKATAYRLTLHPRQPDTPLIQTPVSLTPPPVTVTPLPPSERHPISTQSHVTEERAPAHARNGAGGASEGNGSAPLTPERKREILTALKAKLAAPEPEPRTRRQIRSTSQTESILAAQSLAEAEISGRPSGSKVAKPPS